jgi:hypothetical protein
VNERIQDLSMQARKYAQQYVNESVIPYGKTASEFQRIFESKFAELIVKECLKLNKFQLTSIPLNQEYWDEHNYGFAAAVFRTQSAVKEHFGVSE